MPGQERLAPAVLSRASRAGSNGEFDHSGAIGDGFGQTALYSHDPGYRYMAIKSVGEKRGSAAFGLAACLGLDS